MRLQAQVHALPEHQAMGIPGPQPRSYVITWHPAPEAVAYEYVLTDNFLCFAGCAGDTRQGATADTFLVGYELLEGRPYYWITRVMFADSSYSQWSLISEFQAEAPPVQELVRVAPNPVRGPVRVYLDWAAIPDVDYVSVQVLDRNGQQVRPGFTVWPTFAAFRIDEQTWKQTDLPAGTFIFLFTAQTREGRVLRQWHEKVLSLGPG